MTAPTSSRHKAITEFWGWFAANVGALTAFYERDQMDVVTQEMNRALDRVNDDLAWELGPGLTKEYMLTISAGGDDELRGLADEMIALAPTLPNWEFYAARPARPAPPAVQLPDTDESFETKEWEFVAEVNAETGSLDLIIVSGDLARADKDAARTVVEIYLDHVLGEDAVERSLGEFRIESPVAAHGKNKFKIADLPAYLNEVTHRAGSPPRVKNNRID
jgi:hypothetical protein